jgi:glycogen debranching enzyme
MSTHGFTIHLNVEDETGFIVGGNAWNCLTWMDKMGSSARAGNKGFPATSRSGAPIELTALLYHCLAEYSKLNKEGHYSYSTVTLNKKVTKLEEWAQKIKDNFEDSYWLDEIKDNYAKYLNIYKDVVGSPPGLEFEEARLRPNALVALALTPELFTPEHALDYLSTVEK